MSIPSPTTNTLLQLDALKKLCEDSKKRLIEDDAFFRENVNFFTKSYMVMMCAYLEDFIKDISMMLIDDMNNRLRPAKIPYNLVKWSFDLKADWRKEKEKFESFTLKIKKKDLDEFTSGMPHKTADLFRKLGIDLSKDSIFEGQKEKITLIVVKRNNIIHHSDSASDISFDDILINIDLIKSYIENISKVVVASIS
jgi:RiboL-PSP-HEPN